MYINNIRIRNFRGIEDSTIEFKPGFNLIKGENGKGKTSIVEAIAVGLGGFIGGFSDVSTRHFSKEEIRKEWKLMGDGSCSEFYKTPTEVSLNIEIDERQYELIRSRASVKSSRTTTSPKDIVKYAEQLQCDEYAELPVICLQGAGRVWSQKREKSENVFKTKYSRTAGYIDALADASNIKLLLNWCVKMEQVSWQKESKIAEYEAAKQAVANFMKQINGEGEYKIFYDKQMEELVYSVDHNVATINSLSAGYQSLIWMVFDIAYRMAVLNPAKKMDIAKTKGIVLIDEIDMHIHPRWQWNIIEALRNVFPNVQFIATTHAPILFASAKNVWLIDVERPEITYSESHYGLDVNASIKDFQKTNDIPISIQKEIDSFYNAMDKGKFNEAKEILARVEEETKPESTNVVKMRARFEFDTMDLGDGL
ncbi:MAG: AAA family ATPase [Phascolarctobacterium sp.]|uniref:AAA family ATPase n=1 Tax=Phascolarctobacterium sp. TaxID=2049039 RepID=UPI0026DBC472|nr:AAA family ATPase [Phascolarctobacterium sp.]MDO4921496.1 AAA family ATPase [Phascolarctobacterium sp.]